MKKIFVYVFSVLLIPLMVYSADYVVTDEGQIGNSWRVRENGDILPATTATSDIGGLNDTVAEFHVDTLFVGGASTSAVDFTVQLPVSAFTTAGILMLGNSTPKLVTNNVATAIVWVDGDTDAALQTFRVPADYVSAGGFRVIADLSASATDAAVDFNVYVNRNGITWDSTATDQTAVAVKNIAGVAVGVGSPELVTLTPETDFSSLAAGDFVTFGVWRSDDGSTASDLEIYSAEFFYN